MIDDDDTHECPAKLNSGALYYDFFKWITSIALFAIGGVFSLITQSQGIFQVAPRELLVIVAALGVAALTGLGGAQLQLNDRLDERKRAKRSRAMLSIAMMSLGVGTGWFTMMFADKLMS